METYRVAIKYKLTVDIIQDRVNLHHGKTRKVIQDTDRARHGSPLLLSQDPTLGGHLVSEGLNVL